MHNDGAVAEHYDEDRENKSEEHYQQAEAEKDVGIGFLHAGRVIPKKHHSSVYQVGDAEHQRARPDRSTGGSDVSASPEEPGIHQLHHS